MKNKFYNAVSIIVSILFLVVMAVLLGFSVVTGIWSAITLLVSGHGIIASIVSALPYLVFCIVPGLFFWGCFTAFRDFLRTLR